MSRSPVAQLWLAAAFWLAFAVPALWLARSGFSLDTDSSMRLADVRDLLHGQSWSDTSQWRMNTPFGLPMHWSRLVDAPVALLIAVSGSEKFALTVWPLFLLFSCMAALARIAGHVDRRAVIPVLVLALLGADYYGLFAPGEIDHHNVQLALMLWLLVFLIEQRPGAAAVAVCAALGVGMESLPYCAVAIGAASLWLAHEPARARAFGLTLAACSTLLLLAVTAARYRLAPVCDTYSLFYAALLATGGAGLAAISWLPRHRLAAFAVLAAVLLALAALLNPACLMGPYAGMDARLRLIWLTRVNEARSAPDFATFAPTDFVRGYCYAAFALLAAFFAAPGRARTLTLALAATALLVATFQIRAVPFAILFALPGLAAALSRLPLVPVALGLVLCSDAAFAIAGGLIEGPSRQAARVEAFHAQENCGDAPAVAPLRALPPGRVAAFVDQGPAILAYTDDAVIAGPYHRDGAGILDTYAIFAGPDPRAVLRARRIDYVVTCTATPDWEFYRAKGGLIAQLAAHRVPAWLTPVSATWNVSIYRVAKD
jgi:uncharacterized membrane protein (UPF0136 family)